MELIGLRDFSPEKLEELKYMLASRGSYGSVARIIEFEETYGYRVRVVRGRKVPHGTEGVCFWMGTRNYAKYSDPWGLKTVTRIGLRDDAGTVY